MFKVPQLIPVWFPHWASGLWVLPVLRAEIWAEEGALCSEWVWTRACCVTWRGSWGQQRWPLLAVYMRPHQEGIAIRGKVWESPMLVSLRELTVLSPSWDGGHRGLSVPHSEGCPVCVTGAQKGDVLTLSIKRPVFNFHDRTLKTCVAWGSPEVEEEERKGVRHGSFSGKVIFSLSFLKCPALDLLIVSDSGVSCLTPVYRRSSGAFPQGLSSPLRSRLPMTRWPGPCEEAPLGTVLGRTSHPRVGDGVLVLLGSRDCLGPTWTLCLLSVNQGKETALGSQVLICTIAGEIWESGQLGAVCSLLRQFKLKMWVSLLKSLLLIEWTVQK